MNTEPKKPCSCLSEKRLETIMEARAFLSIAETSKRMRVKATCGKCGNSVEVIR